MSKLEHIDPHDSIKIEFDQQKEQLPTYLFEEVEEELTKILILDAGNSEEETDGAFDLIRNTVDKVRHDIEKAGLSGHLKKFLQTLSKIFTPTQHKSRYGRQNNQNCKTLEFINC